MMLSTVYAGLMVYGYAWIRFLGSFLNAAMVKEGELWVGVVTLGMRFTLFLTLFDEISKFWEVQ